MAKYQYVGPGQGVPGLPNTITEKQAKDLGLSELLRECIKAKLYKPVKDKLKEGK